MLPRQVFNENFWLNHFCAVSVALCCSLLLALSGSISICLAPSLSFTISCSSNSISKYPAHHEKKITWVWYVLCNVLQLYWVSRGYFSMVSTAIGSIGLPVLVQFEITSEVDLGDNLSFFLIICIHQSAFLLVWPACLPAFLSICLCLSVSLSVLYVSVSVFVCLLYNKIYWENFCFPRFCEKRFQFSVYFGVTSWGIPVSWGEFEIFPFDVVDVTRFFCCFCFVILSESNCGTL